MNRDEAKERITKLLPDYLEKYHTGDWKKIRAKKNIRCMMDNGHEDEHPSMSYSDKNGHPILHCFGCNGSMDIFDLIKKDYSLPNFAAAFNKACELFSIEVEPTGENKGRTPAARINHSKAAPVKEEKPKITQEKKAKLERYKKECQERIEETDYYKKRGISIKTAKAYGLGYDPECRKFTNRPPALIIWTSDYTYSARNVSEEAGKNDRYRKEGTAHIFNANVLQTAETPIFVTEGELDALSILEVQAPAVGLGSVSDADLLMQEIQNHKPTVPLILALDNDEAGKKAAAKLADQLKAEAVPFYQINVYGEYKDANEALVKDRDGFMQRIATASIDPETAEQEAKIEAYRASSNEGFLDTFLKHINDNAKNPCIPTKFGKLNEELDGGLYAGLYIVGGISSLGKTTFVQQIGDGIAEAGRDVLFFSLEMSRDELIAKSVSRITYQIVMDCKAGRRKEKFIQAHAKTTRGILDGARYTKYSNAELQLIKMAIAQYTKYASHIYVKEGMGNIGVQQIRNAIADHVEQTGRAPVVIVDYLQILAPYNERGTDKQNTDKAVLELKRISRDYSIPVICISSLNRASYGGEIAMSSFKESGAIEYSADVLIGLQLGKGKNMEDDPEGLKRKMANDRNVEAVILKNRNGRVGGTVLFVYRTLFNCFGTL